MDTLKGKVAVVTGASKGIGAEIARQLADAGAAVVVNYLTSEAGAQKVVDGITGRGGRAIIVGADVTKEEQVVFLFAEAVKAFGKVDILVNNAGVYGFAPLATVTPAEYARQFDINVLAVLLATKVGITHFPESGGSVINIGSVVSTFAPPNSTLAAGSKGALDTITRGLAKELGPRQIRVNAINPGVVLTEGLTAGGLAGGAFEAHAVEVTPLGRIGVPEDIAPPVVFLASEGARWITGVTIIVSGGSFL